LYCRLKNHEGQCTIPVLIRLERSDIMPGSKLLEQDSSWEHPRPCRFLVGANLTGPTSNRQSGVEDCKAGSMGQELSAPSEPG
jgi:hypothetical protein